MYLFEICLCVKSEDGGGGQERHIAAAQDSRLDSVAAAREIQNKRRVNSRVYMYIYPAGTVYYSNDLRTAVTPNPVSLE